MPERIWIVSELYYPEETSTGYLLTKIAEGLARRYPVSVLCSQPTYSARGVRAPSREVRNGVEIVRCWGTTFNKDNLALRLVNLLTITASMFFRAAALFRASDRVLVVTNPPPLPFLVRVAAGLRGSDCVLLIHDVYPEILVAAGMAKSGSFPIKILSWLTRRLYRSMKRIVVLGRDMAKLTQGKLVSGGDVILIPNWADLELVEPTPKRDNALLRELGLSDQFVIQYAGNMGRSHGLENLLQCAERFVDSDIHFLFIGSGAKKAWLESQVGEKGLTNVTVLPSRPRSDQNNFLNACDLAVISFLPGMAGISVPSRMYNILAAGKPILAVTDAESELALTVEEESVGWVVAPNDVEELARIIRRAREAPGQLREMSLRARRAVERSYSLESVIERYLRMFAELDETRS